LWAETQAVSPNASLECSGAEPCTSAASALTVSWHSEPLKNYQRFFNKNINFQIGSINNSNEGQQMKDNLTLVSYKPYNFKMLLNKSSKNTRQIAQILTLYL
jgi:hypothetical protein